MNITSNPNGIQATNSKEFYHIDRGSLSILAGPLNCAFYSAGRLVFNANHASCTFNGKKYKTNTELASAVSNTKTKKGFF